MAKYLTSKYGIKAKSTVQQWVNDYDIEVPCTSIKKQRTKTNYTKDQIGYNYLYNAEKYRSR